MLDLRKYDVWQRMANHASSHAAHTLSGSWKRSFIAEKLSELRNTKWIGTANAIVWRVGSFRSIGGGAKKQTPAALWKMVAGFSKNAVKSYRIGGFAEKIA